MSDKDKRPGNNDYHFDEPEQPVPAEEQPQRFSGIFPGTPQKQERRGSFDMDVSSGQSQVSRQFSGVFKSQTNAGAGEGTSASSKQQRTVAAKTELLQKLPFSKPFEIKRLYILLAIFIPLTLFAYFPAVQAIVSTWWNQIDYGHGFFVIPLVILFLYLRFDSYPGTRSALTWFGLVPLVLCFAMRYVAAIRYYDALEQWSILLWIFAIVWFFYGSRVFLWALPSLTYLVFMFPLPYRYEVLLRGRLQEIAAQFAAGILQVLGEPAIAIKNTIRLGSQELAVEQACSGIRFLISILAIAFGAVLLMKRPWWQNIFVILIAAPLAIFVNAARIAMTGILLMHFHGILEKITPTGQKPSVFADELSGITMIFVAIIVFFSFLWYLGRVFRRVEI